MLNVETASRAAAREAPYSAPPTSLEVSGWCSPGTGASPGRSCDPGGLSGDGRPIARKPNNGAALDTLRLHQAVVDAYDSARFEAAKETGFDSDAFPTLCPYTWVQAMDRGWLPK